MDEEITAENLEDQIRAATDPDLLMELTRYAVLYERDDLLEEIVIKALEKNHLVEKLHGYNFSRSISFPSD